MFSVKYFLKYLWKTKKWWLIPVILLIIIIVLIIFVNTVAPVPVFVYPLV